MSDLVDRLRDDAPNMPHDETEALLIEAADRITQLEAALVAHNCGTPGCLCYEVLGKKNIA